MKSSKLTLPLALSTFRAVSEIAFIALGSNLGDRRGYLEHARAEIDAIPGCRVIGATSNAFTVLADSASQLVITVQPSAAAAGAPIAPAVVVEARDPFGNVDPGFSGQVTASIDTAPASGALSGTVAVNAINGVASFSGRGDHYLTDPLSGCAAFATALRVSGLGPHSLRDAGDAAYDYVARACRDGSAIEVWLLPYAVMITT